MKAYLLKKCGGPQRLNISEMPDPHPAANEVAVRLHYTAINYAEILSRKGLYLWAEKRPYVLGMEGAGVIEAVGSGVDPARLGEAVMVGTLGGCYAECVAVPAVRALPAIPTLSMAENAAFLVNFLTAWVSFFEMGKLQKNENALITAAAGGVGSAAVLLAACQGASVYGMAGCPEKVAFAKSLGATNAFNYRDANSFQQLRETCGGIDVALETVGGKVYRQTFELLKPFGRLMIAGIACLNPQKWNPLSWIRTLRDLPRVNVTKMATHSVAVMSSHLGFLLNDPDNMRTVFENLKNFVVKNGIKPVVGEVFPFSRAGDAHAFIESRRSMGKVLLRHAVAEI